MSSIVLRAERVHKQNGMWCKVVHRNAASPPKYEISVVQLTSAQTFVYSTPGDDRATAVYSDAQPAFLYHGAKADARAGTVVWSNPLPHRFPLGVRAPFLLPDFSPVSFAAARSLFSVKLLQIYKELGGTAVVTTFLQEDGQFRVDFIEDDAAVLPACVADVLFYDRCESGEFLNRILRVHGEDALQLSAPCLCDPDAFLLHAGLERDAAGQATFYRRPFAAPTGTLFSQRHHLYNLAVHRAVWIQQRKILEFAFSLADLTGLQLADVLRPRLTRLADAMLELTFMKYCTEVEPPLRALQQSEAASFVGGLVLAEQCGVHRGTVLHLDARSLYPSIVLEFKLNQLVERLFADLMQARAALSHSKDAVAERSIKILTNAVFGSRMHGNYHDHRLAAEIARRGREVLEQAVQCARDSGYTVLAGDTDGFFAMAAAQPQQQTDVLALLNSRWTHIKFKTERTLQCVVIVNRKCWFGQDVGDDRALAVTVRGMENCKSSTCRYAEDVHAQWQRLVLLRGILTTQQNEEFIAEALRRARELAQQRDRVLFWFQQHPKPNRAHQSIERAVVRVGAGDLIDVQEFLQLSKTERAVDVDGLMKLQIVDPLRRYWNAIQEK